MIISNAVFSIFINNKAMNCGPGTGYDCDCGPGEFLLDAGCFDHNECTSGNANVIQCDSIGGTCSNLVPFYECVCPDGTKVTPWNDPNATCVKLNCDQGYHEIDGACVDIDECALGKHECFVLYPGSICVNYPGRYSCSGCPGCSRPL